VRKKLVKIEIFLHLVFSLEPKNIKWWLKIHTSYLVYSQIWLNLPRDDRHCGYSIKQIPKKNTAVLLRPWDLKAGSTWTLGPEKWDLDLGRRRSANGPITLFWELRPFAFCKHIALSLAPTPSPFHFASGNDTSKKEWKLQPNKIKSVCNCSEEIFSIYIRFHSNLPGTHVSLSLILVSAD